MSALSYSVALVYGRGHAGFSSLHWFFAGFLAAVARPAPYSPLCPLNGCAEALMTEDPLVLFDVWLAEASETESNDPIAMALATANAAVQPAEIGTASCGATGWQ